MEQKRKLKYQILDFCINLLSYIVPKKKGLYVFLPAHDKRHYSGNIKALIEYLSSSGIEMNYYFIALDKNCYNEAKEAGVKNRVHSLKQALWLELRAEILIMDATFPKYHGNFSIVQLWHGTGFKNVGLLNEYLDEENNKLFRKHYKRYKLIISSSSLDVEKQNLSFGVNTAVVTGLPRNDQLIAANSKRESLAQQFEFDSYSKVIAYVPTFRDHPTKEPFSEEFWKVLNTLMKEQNALFVVKKHSWDILLKVPDNYSHIVDYSKRIADVNELLIASDLLITDYSSILTDYVLLDKPIILYTYDIKEYATTCRSIYYDLEEILPTPLIKEEKELYNRLKEDSWRKDVAYIESYYKFNDNFNAYKDNHSSERVYKEIMKLTNRK